jgi:hypothetical protein
MGYASASLLPSLVLCESVSVFENGVRKTRRDELFCHLKAPANNVVVRGITKLYNITS